MEALSGSDKRCDPACLVIHPLLLPVRWPDPFRPFRAALDSREGKVVVESSLLGIIRSSAPPLFNDLEVEAKLPVRRDETIVAPSTRFVTEENED